MGRVHMGMEGGKKKVFLEKKVFSTKSDLYLRYDHFILKLKIKCKKNATMSFLWKKSKICIFQSDRLNSVRRYIPAREKPVEILEKEKGYFSRE
jgi:hypothetical protein